MQNLQSEIDQRNAMLPAKIREAENLAAKAQAELLDKRLAQSREFLDDINPDSPDAPARYLQWHQANHADPIIGPALAARGVTADSARANIDAAMQQPNGIRNLILQSRMGMEKFVEANKPSIHTRDLGGSTQMLAVPGLGGAATVVPGSTATKTATPGEVLTNARALAKLDRGNLGITPDQEAALTRAIDGGLLDPKMVNSRNAHILANVALANPSADFNRLAGNAAMLRNVGYQQKAQAAETLPTILSNLEESGKKLNYNDNKWIAGLQAWVKGVNQDPQLIDYMTQRNDSLLMIANVARGVGMSDFATKLEQEISSPNMSPKALASYVAAQRTSLEPRLANYRRHSIETPAVGTPQGTPQGTPAGIPSADAIAAERARREAARKK